MRASLGSSPMQHEVGEQRLQPGNIDRRHRPVVRNQQEVAQQMNMERRDHQVPFITFELCQSSGIPHDTRYSNRKLPRMEEQRSLSDTYDPPQGDRKEPRRTGPSWDDHL